MVFNKKRSNDRKSWLGDYDRELYLDTNDNEVIPSGQWDEADQSVGSPFGSGQSGRGPSKPDFTQGWWDEADQSVGRPGYSPSWGIPSGQWD